MVSLRTVQETDSEFLFSWANDEAVIEGSFLRSYPISWADHQRWFSARRTDPLTFLFIVMSSEGEPAGQVRFDIVEHTPSEAFISIGVAPPFRQRGVASAAIAQGTARMFSTTAVTLIHAYIKPENHGSKRAFEKAGYHNQGLSTYLTVPALYMKAEKASFPTG